MKKKQIKKGNKPTPSKSTYRLTLSVSLSKSVNNNSRSKR